jgi:Mg2+ and Co2+ transporter CorA
MNLMDNLVTQHDSETNTSTAQATSNNSSVMRVIAILTMIFLPLTTVATFFGMPFFHGTADGGFRVNTHVWLFVAVALSLTFLTLGIWWVWW